MTTPTTQPLQTDRDGRPVAQYWNPRTLAYEALRGDGGAAIMSSMQRKYREDFPGVALNADWSTIQTGAGHTVSVASSILSIATGTTINTETILRCLIPFTIPFRVMFIFMLSQRIANQEFFLEVTNAAGNMLAQWLFSGTSATIGTHNTTNAGTAGTPASPTIASTASYAIAEIELFPDEVYFHSRPADSTAVRSLTAVRTRFIPDPNETYFVQIRARNLGTAPASSTTLFVDAVTVQDITELTAEITAGRGAMVGSQAVAVQAVGGTIGTVSTVSTLTTASTLTTMTTGNIQSINTAFADTSTTLGANAVFNGTSRDFSTTQRTNRFLAASTADQAGTLFVEQSNDGTNWVMTHSQATASTPDADATARHIARIDAEVCNRFARVRYRNGATAQSAFRLISKQQGV
jgi:hypothetical protein